MSIDNANICSSVQDHRQKFKVSLYQAYFLEEQMRGMKFTMWKLVLQDRVGRRY